MPDAARGHSQSLAKRGRPARRIHPPGTGGTLGDTRIAGLEVPGGSLRGALAADGRRRLLFRSLPDRGAASGPERIASASARGEILAAVPIDKPLMLLQLSAIH